MTNFMSDLSSEETLAREAGKEKLPFKIEKDF
jgi:hypothetical protein